MFGVLGLARHSSPRFPALPRGGGRRGRLVLVKFLTLLAADLMVVMLFSRNIHVHVRTPEHPQVPAAIHIYVTYAAHLVG